MLAFVTYWNLLVAMCSVLVVKTGVSDWQTGGGDSGQLPRSAAFQVSHAPEVSGGGE